MFVVDVGVLDDGEWGGRKTRLGGNDLKEEPMRRKNKMSLFKRFSQIPPLIHSYENQGSARHNHHSVLALELKKNWLSGFL